MECKVICDVIEAVKEKRFNRYIVECKGPYSLGQVQRNEDLIDTLWNVKLSIFIASRSFIPFNRYIVECKGENINKIAIRQQDLIDTLWNVKLNQEKMVLGTLGDLIDTLWNVKTNSE